MNKYNSIIFTKIFLLVSQVFLVFLGIGLYPLLMFYTKILGMESYFILFLISFYLCIGFGFYILITLDRLIKNIEREEIFIIENVSYLRYISWASFIIAIICFISAFYYVEWILGFVVGVFMGAILRVIKNVFEKAILIKEENDYTV